MVYWLEPLAGKGVGEEQGDLRRGRVCVNQIFSFKMTVKKYLGEGRKLYAAFIDVKRAYDRVDMNGFGDVMKI